MNDQTLDLYTTIHQGAKMSIAGLDMLIQNSADEAYKTYLIHKQNRYKQIAAKAGQALQEYSEYSESTAQPSVIPQVATQTMASVNSLTDQVRQDQPAQVMLFGFQKASHDLADSMQKNTDATQNARNLAFSLLELQQNDLYNFSNGLRQ
jgi:hypothetical protein